MTRPFTAAERTSSGGQRPQSHGVLLRYVHDHLADLLDGRVIVRDELDAAWEAGGGVLCLPDRRADLERRAGSFLRPLPPPSFSTQPEDLDAAFRAVHGPRSPEAERGVSAWINAETSGLRGQSLVVTTTDDLSAVADGIGYRALLDAAREMICHAPASPATLAALTIQHCTRQRRPNKVHVGFARSAMVWMFFSEGVSIGLDAKGRWYRQTAGKWAAMGGPSEAERAALLTAS